MQIFLDTCDIAAVAKAQTTGLIEGVTTSYTRIIGLGRNPVDVYRELIVMGIPHISAEVLGDATCIVRDAHNLIETFDNKLTIKVPCTKDGLMACRELKKEGAEINVTLVFSAAQSILAAKTGADYVTVPVGMCDSNSVAGLEVVRSVVELCARANRSAFKGQTKVMADCIHDVYKVTRAFYNGADIVSMPPDIFEKMYDHVLTREGLMQ